MGAYCWHGGSLQIGIKWYPVSSNETCISWLEWSHTGWQLAPFHRAQGLAEWFDGNHMLWPTLFPDLKMAQYLWESLDLHTCQRSQPPSSRNQQREYPLEKCVSILPVQIHRLVESMPLWIEALLVAKNRFFHTFFTCLCLKRLHILTQNIFRNTCHWAVFVIQKKVSKLVDILVQFEIPVQWRSSNRGWPVSIWVVVCGCNMFLVKHAKLGSLAWLSVKWYSCGHKPLLSTFPLFWLY